MVGHEAVSVTDPIVTLVDMLKSIQKIQAVLLILEDGFLLIPAGCDVVYCAGIFYAKRTGHNVARLSQKKANVKLQDVTL